MKFLQKNKDSKNFNKFSYIYYENNDNRSKVKNGLKIKNFINHIEFKCNKERKEGKVFFLLNYFVFNLCVFVYKAKNFPIFKFDFYI